MYYKFEVEMPPIWLWKRGVTTEVTKNCKLKFYQQIMRVPRECELPSEKCFGQHMKGSRIFREFGT